MCLKSLLTYLFYAICSAVAIWMTCRQIEIYLSNEDTTSVQYMSFSTATENHYPDFTICLLNYHPGDQFNESVLPYNLTSADLTNLLHGAASEESKTNNGDENLLEVLLDFVQTRNLSFGDLINDDVKNIIASYYMESTMPLEGRSQNVWSEGSSNFDKTFDSTQYRCWTRNLDYVPTQMIKKEWIQISRGVLNDFRQIQLTLHHPHQTFRHDRIHLIDLMHVNITETQKLPSLTITVTHIKLIKRRHSSKQKCDQILHHDDNKFLQEGSKIFGCIPLFWRDIAESWKSMSNLSYCTSPDPYQFYYSNFGHRWDTRHLVYKEYDPPCSKMLVTYDLSTREDENIIKQYIETEGELLIKLLYISDEYEEIKNLRKFDEESLFSQVGGFIGIMLGASLFHIPDILVQIITKLDIIWKRGICKRENQRKGSKDSHRNIRIRSMQTVRR